jgi:hypothetical protein
MALPAQQTNPPATPNAPTEQLAKRKYEQIDPEQSLARVSSLNLSRASYNRSVGKLIVEELISSDMAAISIHGAVFESEIYFDKLLSSIDRD